MRRALLLLALALFAPRAARADEPPFTDTGALPPPPPPPPKAPAAKPTLDAFVYTTPQDKYYLRGAIEVGTVLIVGNVDYLLNTTARGGTLHPGDARWDLRYDWPTFHDKLTGDYWRVDTNHFNTNYVSHPFAGSMYYTAARANRLSTFESLGYTFVGALSWEMFGELREEVSINDVIVTSSAGFAIGETLTQMSSFFYRSKKSAANDVLAAIFSPAKALNDWADGAEHARSANTDALGLTRDEWHRFHFFAGAGTTWQPSGTYLDQRAGLDLAVVNLPGWEDEGKHQAFFDDGNAAALHFETTLSHGKLADATFKTRVVPTGFWWRDANRDASGALHGDAALLGYLATFEYSVHDYDRDRARPIDLLTILSPIGLVGEYDHDAGALHAHTRLEVSGDFAGVTAYALDDYRAAHNHDDTNLQTVLKQEGYYHALGASVAPSFELGAGAFDLGSRFQLESWSGIEGFDEQQSRISQEIRLSDRRLDMRAWLGFTVPSTPVRLELLGRRRERTGEVGDVRVTQGETSLYVTGGLVF